MKGLLIKDLMLLKNQKNYLLLLLLIAVVVCVNNDNLIGGISYILFASTFATLSTFSYDEAENCLMHLMTLPSGRKEYINAKYVFGMANPLVCTLPLMIIVCLFETARGAGWAAISELILATLIILFLVWIMFAVYFPIQIKFGSEKVRVVLLIIIGAIAGIGFALDKLKTSDSLLRLFEKFSEINEYAAAGIICGISIVAVAVSHMISQKIMTEKEF